MTTTLSNSIPAYSSGTLLTTSGTSSTNSVIYTTGGNVGIGTSTTYNSRLTINSNGTVIMGNNNPAKDLDVYSEGYLENLKTLKIKLFDLINDAIREGGLIDGSFMNELLGIFDQCGGWNIESADDFKKIAEIVEGKKIPRMIVSQFNDIITDRIISTWGFDLEKIGEIFEKIGNDAESNNLPI
jgi:hypothetical protein